VEVADDGGAGRSDRGRDLATSGPGRSGSGHGLLGMRERVTTWGGALSTGTRPDGGFRVLARLSYRDPSCSGWRRPTT